MKQRLAERSDIPEVVGDIPLDKNTDMVIHEVGSSY